MIYVLLFAAPAVAAHALFRRFVPPERLIEQHEVAGFLVAVVGVLYSVVLGFLVGTVWNTFTAAQQTTDAEAGYVADAFGFASHVGQPQQRQLQRLLARYAIGVRDGMSAAARPEKNSQDLDFIGRAVDLAVTLPAPPASWSAGRTLESTTIRTALLDNLRHIGDARRLRIVQSQSRLPRAMYAALIVGAIMVIAFAFLFGVKSFLKQMTMTALVAGSIGLFFGLIVELSTPFSGPIHVSPDAWTYVIENNHLEKFAK